MIKYLILLFLNISIPFIVDVDSDQETVDDAFGSPPNSDVFQDQVFEPEVDNASEEDIFEDALESLASKSDHDDILQPVEADTQETPILTRPDPCSKYVGNSLVNTSNHCYLNSLLQILHSSVKFRKAAQAIDEVNGTYFHDVLMNRRNELEWLRQKLHNNMFAYHYERFTKIAEEKWPGNDFDWVVPYSAVEKLAKKTLDDWGNDRPRYQSEALDLFNKYDLPYNTKELKRLWVDLKAKNASEFYYGEQCDQGTVLQWLLNAR